MAQLRRAMREVEVQRLLMGKGAKQSIVAKRGSGQMEKDEMKWDAQASGKKGLPEADEGIATGARVWKWKQERKR